MKKTGISRNVLRAEPISSVIVLASLAVLPAQTPSLAEPPVRKAEVIATGNSLPNGASSINETYGDWIVACKKAGDQKTCTFSQVHTGNRTGEQVFAIELQPPSEGKANSVILLPFGLRLDDGVTLKIDEQTLEPEARFLTCVPNGCLVPVAFPADATEAMKKAEHLIIGATSSGEGEPLKFTVSLNGFTEALNRAVELSK